MAKSPKVKKTVQRMLYKREKTITKLGLYDSVLSRDETIYLSLDLLSSFRSTDVWRYDERTISSWALKKSLEL